MARTASLLSFHAPRDRELVSIRGDSQAVLAVFAEAAIAYCVPSSGIHTPRRSEIGLLHRVSVAERDAERASPRMRTGPFVQTIRTTAFGRSEEHTSELQSRR